MATTTFPAILDRFQAVCEGATLSLSATQVPFSHAREPNAVVDASYYLEEAGLNESRVGTSDLEFRVDRLTVWLARRSGQDGQTAIETLETTLTTLERLVIADGRSNHYHATVAGRSAPELTGDGGLIVAGLTFAVDYDFSTV